MVNEIFALGNYPKLQPDASFAQKLFRLLKIYGLLLLVLFFAVAPLLLLTDKFVTLVVHHKSLNELNRHLFQSLHKKIGFVGSILFVCLAGPMFEELIFRFPLSFTKRKVTIGLSIALFYFGASFYHPHNLIMVKLGAEIVLAILVFGICYAYVPDIPLNLSDHLKKQLIILSIVLFALMHISNYRPVDLKLFWIYSIYVVPQLIMGIGITYTRFKNGFLWGLALHCLINTVTTLLTFGIVK
jgi:membrane protease YdiL (CAAX protease family)